MSKKNSYKSNVIYPKSRYNDTFIINDGKIIISKRLSVKKLRININNNIEINLIIFLYYILIKIYILKII